jgi:hypothetical protein
MTWYAEPYIPGSFRWRCRRRVAAKIYSGSGSIRQGSWFHHGHLTLQEVLYLTNDNLRRETASQIQYEHQYSDHTIADWGMFCRKILLVYLEGSSEKIGGPNKTVEIDKTKFGRRNAK